MRDKILMTKYLMYRNHGTNCEENFMSYIPKIYASLKCVCTFFLKLISCRFDLSLLNKIEVLV